MQNNSQLSFTSSTIKNIEFTPLKSSPGTEFKTNYLIENEIGRGRFAKVCKVRHKDNGDQYAAKIIRRKKNGLDTTDAIKREIDILHLARDISSIVNINGVFETKLDVTLLLEFSSGGDLYHLVIDLDENLAEEFVIAVIRQLLLSIAFLHSRSIVHLDIKPENILLKSPYPCSRVALCDFGLAKILEENTMLRDLVGTPDYVAPEIIDYSPIQLVTDVWSTGCVAYFLLTSISPFNGPTKEETYSNVAQVKIDYSPDIFQDISTQAVDFIQQVIKKSPKDRPSVFNLQEHPWLAESDISRTSDSAEDSRESSNDLEMCDCLANIDINSSSTNSNTTSEMQPPVSSDEVNK